jgi:hypothetical protein
MFTYGKFMKIVTGHRKYPSWNFSHLIKAPRGRGMNINLEDGKAMLSVDIGRAEEIDVSDMKMDERISVKEVFERFNLGVNR